MGDQEKDKNEQLVARKIWISNKIRLLCEQTDTSIEALSILSGLSSEYMHKVSTASIMPSQEALQSIAMVFSISVSDLLPQKDS